MGKFVKIRQCDYNGSSQPARPEPVTRFTKRMRYILTSFLRPRQARLLKLDAKPQNLMASVFPPSSRVHLAGAARPSAPVSGLVRVVVYVLGAQWYCWCFVPRWAVRSSLARGLARATR